METKTCAFQYGLFLRPKLQKLSLTQLLRNFFKNSRLMVSHNVASQLAAICQGAPMLNIYPNQAQA
nr:hypothetical protein [Mesorhizobium sp.]